MLNHPTHGSFIAMHGFDHLDGFKTLK
jgi:hypothetical protein